MARSTCCMSADLADREHTDRLWKAEKIINMLFTWKDNGQAKNTCTTTDHRISDVAGATIVDLVVIMEELFWTSDHTFVLSSDRYILSHVEHSPGVKLIGPWKQLMTG